MMIYLLFYKLNVLGPSRRGAFLGLYILLFFFFSSQFFWLFITTQRGAANFCLQKFLTGLAGLVYFSYILYGHSL